MDDQLNHALDLLRRLPPQQVEKNLAGLTDLVPDLCEDLLSAVDQPLKIARDKVTGKDYLLCDYNRDGDSYRSPWSNSYEPEIEDGAVPSEKLRQLEMDANLAFAIYTDMYYDGAISSVYLWDLDAEPRSFGGVVLIKKTSVGSNKIKGCWDSIHLIEVQEESDKQSAHYKVSSSIILRLKTAKDAFGTINLGGSLTRQTVRDATVSESSPHIANIGAIVEEIENKEWNFFACVSLGKTDHLLNSMRMVKKPTDRGPDVLFVEPKEVVPCKPDIKPKPKLKPQIPPIPAMRNLTINQQRDVSSETVFLPEKRVSQDSDERFIKLSQDLEKLKNEKSAFHRECKKEKKRLNKEIEVLTAQLEEPDDEQKLRELEEEYSIESEKLQNVKLSLAEKSREYARLQRTLDDIPSRAELNQYQKRLIELYDQIASKHYETKKFYILYNQLEDTRIHLDKELTLLDSIMTNFNQATANPHTRDQFLTQFEQIVSNLNLAQAKIEKMKLAENTRKDELNETHVDLVEKQRSYYKAVRELKEEIKKNELLSAQ